MGKKILFFFILALGVKYLFGTFMDAQRDLTTSTSILMQSK